MGKNDNGNNGRTELVFVVDRSGSMGGLESDTIGGFNSMLSKQRTIAGECRVTGSARVFAHFGLRPSPWR